MHNDLLKKCISFILERNPLKSRSLVLWEKTRTRVIHTLVFLFDERKDILYITFSDNSLCTCDVNSRHLHIKQTDISQKESEETKIIKRSYFIILKVLPNKTIKNFEVRGTLIITYIFLIRTYFLN